MKSILFVVIVIYLSLQYPKREISGKLIDISKNPRELVLYVSIDESIDKSGTIIIRGDTIETKKIISYISLGDSISHEVGSGILYVSKYKENKYNTVKFYIPKPSRQVQDQLQIK